MKWSASWLRASVPSRSLLIDSVRLINFALILRSFLIVVLKVVLWNLRCGYRMFCRFGEKYCFFLAVTPPYECSATFVLGNRSVKEESLASF